MNNTKKLEEEYQNQRNALNQAQGDALGLGKISTPYSCCTLSDSVSKRLAYAKQESRMAEKLEELKFLLSKNPEVERILDLIKETETR